MRHWDTTPSNQFNYSINMLSVTPGQSFLQNLYNFVSEQHKFFTSVAYHKLKTEEKVLGKITTLKKEVHHEFET